MHRPHAGENLPAPGLPPLPSANPFAVASPTAPPPASVRALPTIAELLHSFKRRWVLALMIGGVLAAGAAAAIWMAMPSGKHQVQATLQFKSSTTNLLGGNSTIPQSEFDVQVENHKKYMETKGFLDKVAAEPEVLKQPMIAEAEDRAQLIKNALTFKRESYEIVTLTLNGDEPEQMQVVLKTLVAKYVQKDLEDAQGQRRASIIQLDRMIAELEGKIDTAREKMKDTTNATGKVDATAIALKKQEINTLGANKQTARQEKDRLELERDQVADQLKTGAFSPDPADVAALLKTSPPVLTAGANLAAAVADRKRLEVKLKAGDPSLDDANNKVKAADDAVKAAEKESVAAAAADLKDKARLRLEEKRQDLTSRQELARKTYEATDAQLKTAQEELKGMSNGANDQEFLRNDVLPLEQQKAGLMKQRSDLQQVDENPAKRIEVLEDARIFKNLNLKQKAAFAAIAAIGGLLGVCLLIAYLEWRNRRVDGVEQVVSELGMRVIGTIPAFPSRAALRSGEAGANQNWRFILNESVNSTRTMLLHTARTQQMQVILVTSAMQGEGKTSLSSQLATSMATAGLRTLILDCDLRNPSMQKLFDIPVSPGCAEILLQEIDISDAVQPTSVPNLWIIPAGQCNHRVIAALAQGHPMEALLNRLRGQFDIIVVDSCPILPVADTLLVAQHVDGVVFSILQDVSQLPKVQDASDRLAHLNIPLLGAVVNGIKPDVQAYGYNYVKQLPA